MSGILMLFLHKKNCIDTYLFNYNNDVLSGVLLANYFDGICFLRTSNFRNLHQF